MFHCSVIKVPVILATAILDYHIFLSLSRTFFYFFETFSELFPLVSVFRDSQSRLSHLVRLVKHFFEVFQLLFLATSVANGERGIWTLAPLLTTYSLSRGAPSASWVFLLSLILTLYSVSRNGESGIRTHAPLRTNGFQDRLVMTTSISLRMLLC